MKPLFSSLCLAVLLVLSSPSGALQAEEDIAGQDSLGELALGRKDVQVIKLLGQPASKGKDVEWDAIGEWVQEWQYPAHGLALQMASKKKNGKKTIFSIAAGPGCPWATARNIRIGSPEAAVRKAYGPLEDKENTVAGESFVAGSLYGGVIFRFQRGKVSEIFIGALAE